MRTARISGFSNVTDNIAFRDVCPSSGSYSLEVRIRGLVTVLVINDYRISEIATVPRESDFSTTRCKNWVSLAGRNVDSQMLVFIREFFAYNADSRNDVRDSLHSDFLIGREPVVDTFEIDAVLLGRHVRKAVAFNDTVDFVGVVFQECLEYILDSVFHDPQRIES